MFLGTLRIELFIPYSNSLKCKRQAISRIKEKIRNNFNVAVAEEAIDKWQRAILFAVGINVKKSHLEKTFSSIENMLYNFRDTEVISAEREFL
ncbi:MAG: DUF503 domain-containing protein [Candidatus Omnitrophica bacterium]|nr:DUF503 domain-containing protein [Candidatus Omnitrophota bacterium]